MAHSKGFIVVLAELDRHVNGHARKLFRLGKVAEQEIDFGKLDVSDCHGVPEPEFFGLLYDGVEDLDRRFKLASVLFDHAEVV